MTNLPGCTYRPAWQQIFLNQLKMGRPEQLAARNVQVGIDKVRHTEQHDESFRLQCEEARRIGKGKKGVTW